MAKVFGPAINIDDAVNYEVFQTEEQLTQQMKILRDAGFTYVDISYEGLVYQYSKEWEENFLRALDNTGLIPYQSHALFLNAVVREGDHLRMNLSPEQKTALRLKLEKQSGRNVLLECSTDSTLLGGIVVEMDGKVIDGSVRTRLQDIKEVMNT